MKTSLPICFYEEPFFLYLEFLFSFHRDLDGHKYDINIQKYISILYIVQIKIRLIIKI